MSLTYRTRQPSPDHFLYPYYTLTDDASVGLEQLALMREEVDRPNLVSDWPATPHPRSTVHDAVLRNRSARHPDERHAVHPVGCGRTVRC